MHPQVLLASEWEGRRKSCLWLPWGIRPSVCLAVGFWLSCLMQKKCTCSYNMIFTSSFSLLLGAQINEVIIMFQKGLKLSKVFQKSYKPIKQKVHEIRTQKQSLCYIMFLRYSYDSSPIIICQISGGFYPSGVIVPIFPDTGYLPVFGNWMLQLQNA